LVLIGNLVILREERTEDLAKQVALRNDLDTQAWSKALPPDFTQEMYEARYTKREFSFDRTDGKFTIISKKNNEYIGHISYSEYSERFSATIGIVVDKQYWGTGMAYDAQEVLLKFLFLELGVRVVRLWTQSGNIGMVRLAKKSGFQVSATIRQTVYIRGKINDTLVVDLLREEYFQRHPELIDTLPLLS
jgi:ribosomal-protein-alanine N-acetyltransferase